MTLSVLGGHSPIASLFSCNLSYLWHVVWSLCIFKASCKFWGPIYNSGTSEATVIKFYTHVGRISACLQCFDTVGWASGRASGP